MTPQLLERMLKDLPRYATLVKDYPYRKVWRAELDGEAFYLKFYPEKQNRLRRLFRGSLAMREFLRLQWLQKAKVPAARAHSVLMGFNIAGERGDAVIIEAIEPSVTLSEMIEAAHLAGTDIPGHRELVRQMLNLLLALGRAGLGHGDLHTGNFLVKEGQLYLIDAYPLHKKGILLKDVMRLANSAGDVATRTDLQRSWNELGPGGTLPPRNTALGPIRRKLMSRIYGDNKYFGKLREGEWDGVCFKRHGRPRRWSHASQNLYETEQWAAAWRTLLGQLLSDQLSVIKRSASGDVLEGQIIVGGRPIEVIVKRPRRRYWYRYLNEIGRGSRARRGWWKSWRCIHRDIPCAWPLLLMEKRTLGYLTDAVIVFEKVTGPTMATVDLDLLESESRELLLQRCGQMLRKLEAAGLYHWDAKASNFMVQMDDPTGPLPLLVDVDGIRNHWGVGEGMRRLLLSMMDRPQYTPRDSLILCRGYAPFAPMTQTETQLETEPE